MAKTNTQNQDLDKLLQERKIKALEKIAASLDSLAFWFEGVDKEGWDDRLQFYLGEWQKRLPKVDKSE